MLTEDRLKAACADAERRGLAELKPLLETLARSTAALREFDRSVRPGDAGSRPDPTATGGGAGGGR